LGVRGVGVGVGVGVGSTLIVDDGTVAARGSAPKNEVPSQKAASNAIAIRFVFTDQLLKGNEINSKSKIFSNVLYLPHRPDRLLLISEIGTS
jgi:hypothetical protein